MRKESNVTTNWLLDILPVGVLLSKEGTGETDDGRSFFSFLAASVNTLQHKQFRQDLFEIELLPSKLVIPQGLCPITKTSNQLVTFIFSFKLQF